jgi:nucleoside-diphosphate-sugar epimerase
MSQLRVVACLQGETITRKETPMRVFVAGATGALGRHLVPGLVAAGHEVTATTRTPGKLAQLRQAGADPGASNEKARKELGWEPRYASWREGFRAWVSA